MVYASCITSIVSVCWIFLLFLSCSPSLFSRSLVAQWFLGVRSWEWYTINSVWLLLNSIDIVSTCVSIYFSTVRCCRCVFDFVCVRCFARDLFNVCEWMITILLVLVLLLPLLVWEHFFSSCYCSAVIRSYSFGVLRIIRDEFAPQPHISTTQLSKI